jgi:hypothetical protein
MRVLKAIGFAGLLPIAALAGPAVAQEAFDACAVFTQQDAESALGTAARGEAVNPKVKRPRVVSSCTYNGVKDGKPVSANAGFHVGKNEADARRAFEDHRLRVQTKPLMIPGAEGAFWSAKTAEMSLRKGRTWIIVSVGSPQPSEREMEPARKLAELLGKKL